MANTLAIDPGLSGLGVAYFEGEDLLCAWYSPAPPRSYRRGISRDGARLERGPKVWRNVAASLSWLSIDPRIAPDRVVFEVPKIYDGRAGYGIDPADLIELAGVVGACTAIFPGAEVAGVLARDWKGQTPKPVMLARIGGWIEDRGWRDRVIIPRPKPSLVHNAIDAAGLGMVTLGLAGKKIADPFGE